LRIALLLALAENPDAAGEKLTFRRFAGRSVLAHQIDAVLAMGCESVICLASGLSQDLLSCQHHAEAGGAKFHTIDSSRRLASMTTAQDEVFVIADGLLPEASLLVSSLSDRAKILTFPAEVAVTKGFERLDGTRAWAGAMRIWGSAVERLSDLPADADAASSLLRIALQTGTPTAPLDPAVLAEGRWSLKDSYAERAEREKLWVASHIQPASFAAPGTAIAERMGARLARDFIGGAMQRSPWFLAAGAGVFAGVASLLGYPMVAMGLAGLMVFGERIGGVFERLIQAGSPSTKGFSLSKIWRLATDAMIIALCAVSMPEDTGPADSGLFRLFLPLMLIALLRLGERIGRPKWRETYADRISLVALLLPAVLFGQLQLVIPVFSLLVLASFFFKPFFLEAPETPE
jgi:hypothetical protein